MNTYLIVAGSFLLIIFFAYARSKRAKNKIVYVIDTKCTGCQRCLKTCRYKALEIEKNEIGRQFVVLKYPEKCTACRDCVIVCKFKALELVNRLVP